jgi:hypothetical protein
MRTSLLYLTLGGLVLAGCVAEPSSGPAAPVGGTGERLAATLDLPLDPGASRVAVSVARDAAEEAPRHVDLEVQGGSVSLRRLPDGDLEVVDLQVVLGDIVFDEDELPPHGLHLTGLAFRLGDVASVPASRAGEDGRLAAAGQVELVLDWSSVVGAGPGGVVPLGSQRVTAVVLEVEVSTTDDGKALVKLHGRRHGTFVESSGALDLSELGLELRALG